MTTASAAVTKAKTVAPMLAPPPQSAGIIPIGGQQVQSQPVPSQTQSLFPSMTSPPAATPSLMTPTVASTPIPVVTPLAAAAAPKPTGFQPPTLPSAAPATAGLPSGMPGVGLMNPAMMAQMTPQQQSVYQQQQLMLSMTPMQLQQFGMQRGMNQVSEQGTVFQVALS
jgi:hypothetical protein